MQLSHAPVSIQQKLRLVLADLLHASQEYEFDEQELAAAGINAQFLEGVTAVSQKITSMAQTVGVKVG